MGNAPIAAPNAAQIDYWNATAGNTWARYHDQLDSQIAPLGMELLRNLRPAPGESLLDIGCGCGQTTLDIATRVGPSGTVTGIDVSLPMLQIAQSRPPPAYAGRIEFREADAQIADLGVASFDAAFSRFGVMFFSDPVAAFANIRRALKTDGRLGFVCWRPLEKNPWMLEPLAAALPFLPRLEPSDPDAPGPFAFSNAGRVREILSNAGFNDIEIRPFDAHIGVGSLEETLELALQVGPLGSALREHPAYRDRVAGPVRELLATHVTASGVLMWASVWIVHARNLSAE